MESPKKPSKSRSKQPKGRPVSTSAISQPPQQDTPQTLSRFSPDGVFFALIVLAIDKHRLRVYNTATGRALSEYTLDSGRVTALEWGTELSNNELHSPSKKRKKAIDQTVEQEKDTENRSNVVILGLSDGTIIFFSPVQSKILHRLTHPASSHAILSLALGQSESSQLWSSSADSTVRLWDTEKHIVLKSWKSDDRIPYTTLSVRPGENLNELLTAHHSIKLFSTAEDASSKKPKLVTGFTGHATSVKSLVWFEKTRQAMKFLSVAESDRFVHIWDVDTSSNIEKPIASISIDSDVKAVSLDSGYPTRNTFIVLSSSGKVYFTPVPDSLPSRNNGNDVSHDIHSLLPRSTLSSSSRSQLPVPSVFDLVPLSTEPGSIRVVRLVKGVQPVFSVVKYLDEHGNYIQSPNLEEIPDISVSERPSSALNKRYSESKLLTTSSGLDTEGLLQEDDSQMDQEPDGALRVDLAELSLGQRLAVTGTDASPPSDSENEENAGVPVKSSKKKPQINAIPANSLTRTLIQALHSSDSRLLEMCLAHSDPALVGNTVRKLPPQLAIPLIDVCVERLGKGNRAANMKGGGGGASSQRGSGLLIWLRTVLAVHTGHLMTIPDLVARLSGFHSALSARLSLHESLLALSGRLDMVLSQVELRAATTPASLRPSKNKSNSRAQVNRYIEGETETDVEEDNMDVDVERGSGDEGSVEDIELGGDGEDDDEESDEDDVSIDEFIDGEAEEYSDEEEDDESE